MFKSLKLLTLDDFADDASFAIILELKDGQSPSVSHSQVSNFFDGF